MRKNLLRTSDRVLPVERQSLFFLFQVHFASLPCRSPLYFVFRWEASRSRKGRGLSSALPDCAVKIENASFAGQETARFFLRTILSCCTLEPDRI